MKPAMRSGGALAGEKVLKVSGPVGRSWRGKVLREMQDWQLGVELCKIDCEESAGGVHNDATHGLSRC